MKNYFEGIGFAKDVPMVILDNTIYAWSKHDLSIKRNGTSEYTVISSNRADNCIHFELLTGIDLYSVRFDGDLEIRRGGKKLRYDSSIPVDAAMYIFLEMLHRVETYRMILGETKTYGESKLFGKVPVYLVGWLADLVCWKDKSYTLSEANIGTGFRSNIKETTIVLRFSIDNVKYRLLYDIDNDYEEINLRANRTRVTVVDTDLANFMILKLAENFKKMVDNAELNGIVCNV